MISHLNAVSTLPNPVFIFNRMEPFHLRSIRWSLYVLDLLWGFTESDFATFVVPDMAFGLLGALSRSSLINGGCPSGTEIFRRLPILLAFNWTNLLVFDLANQRSPGSVREDKINKPWRPLPTGKISLQQTRRMMLVIVPLSMCLNYHLGVWGQGSLIHLITWLYNDLGGGDEAILRELLIAVGYAMFNSASLKISACGLKEREECDMNSQGLLWTGMISAVIFTTMQIQDLKDQQGDRLRGRKTVALFLGQDFSRRSIAFFVVIWSGVCIHFWDTGLWGLLVTVLGLTVAWRVTRHVHSRQVDRQTWQLWCLWLVMLYFLPTIGEVGYGL